MAVVIFLTLLVQGFILNKYLVGDKLDEDTCERMKWREKVLSREMTQLLQELKPSGLEQRSLQQGGFAWVALLFSALQQWQFWALAGVLVLLFWLGWWLGKRSKNNKENDEQEESEGEDADDERDLLRPEGERPARDSAVAEAKFFSHIARQALHDSFHLKCLQLCGRDFLNRLDDITSYLHQGWSKKCINHFFIGNKSLPEEIILTSAVLMAELYNLLYHLVDNPAANNE
ncbi:PREDICTED: uncharacterized protein LOC104471709, partial [Pterocles gutturalis]|uniref:uncharacterized protein LOC104471709 n=1 Tax=Pterocles gutturalis TaxID=240206 RepID=UPI000528D4C6